AAMEAAKRRLDADARAGVELRGFIGEPRREPLAEHRYRRFEGAQLLGERLRRGGQFVETRSELGLDAVAMLAIGRARQHLLPREGEKRLERAKRAAILQALRPALARQHPRRHLDLVEGFGGNLVLLDEVFNTPLQAARPRAAAAFIAQEPAPQLRALLAGERRREGIVGGLEEMVALVENVARRQIGIIESAERRLDHHQRMIGYHQPRAPRPAHALLDETAMIMRAGGMD